MILKQYSSPEAELVEVRFEVNILSYGATNAPGRGFNNNNANVNSYDTEF